MKSRTKQSPTVEIVLSLGRKSDEESTKQRTIASMKKKRCRNETKNKDGRYRLAAAADQDGRPADQWRAADGQDTPIRGQKGQKNKQTNKQIKVAAAAETR